MNKKMSEESVVRNQYSNANKLNARINLHARHTVSEEIFYPWVFRHLALKNGMAVLEIGCGTGAVWRAGEIPEGASLTLTDLNEGMLKETENNLKSVVPENTRFMQANVMDLPFEDESFDLVMMHHVLHHVPDIEKALLSVRRVLKPGGFMTTTTTGADTTKELFDLIDEVTDGGSEPLKMSFTMDNGEAHLSKVFGRVERFDYPSHLLVTDANDLIAYIDSMMTIVDLNDQQREQVREIVEKAVAEKGGFYIRKTTGMFRAHK